MNRFIAFDVETPNERNDRMSACGITVIENGSITDSYFSLVNPQTYFAEFNSELTGITAQSVKNSPTFPKIWEEISGYLTSGIIIAHNAPFDMRVLGKCLSHYNIDTGRYLPYACTVQMGRRCCPDLPNHKLNTMCDHFGIELDHHKADSDSYACANLLINYIKKGLDVTPYLRYYDLYSLKTVRKKES